MPTYSYNLRDSQKRHTFETRILHALQQGGIMTTDDILVAIDEPATKLTYAIDGLKKGIAKGLVQKIETPGEKRLWAGHRYALIPRSE